MPVFVRKLNLGILGALGNNDELRHRREQPECSYLPEHVVTETLHTTGADEDVERRTAGRAQMRLEIFDSDFPATVCEYAMQGRRFSAVHTRRENHLPSAP